MKVKVNNNWVDATPYVKVNNAWVKATPHFNVNGEWKTEDNRVFAKLTMYGAMHDSYYGQNTIRDNDCFIASGYGGTQGKCVISSRNKIAVKNGDIIELRYRHAAHKSASGFFDSTGTQRAVYCLADSNTGTGHNILVSDNGLAAIKTITHTISGLSDTPVEKYVNMMLTTDKRSTVDTYAYMYEFKINGQVIY